MIDLFKKSLFSTLDMVDFNAQLSQNITTQQRLTIQRALSRIGSFFTDDVQLNIAFTNTKLSENVSAGAILNTLGGVADDKVRFNDLNDVELLDGYEADLITVDDYRDALDADKRNGRDQSFINNIYNTTGQSLDNDHASAEDLGHNNAVAGIYHGATAYEHEIKGIELTTANAKAVKLAGSDSESLDGVVVLNADHNYSDRELFNLLLHEVGHLLGFTSAADKGSFGLKSYLSAEDGNETQYYEDIKDVIAEENTRINPLDLGKYVNGQYGIQRSLYAPINFGAVTENGVTTSGHFVGESYFSINGGSSRISEFAAGQIFNDILAESDFNRFHFQASHWSNESFRSGILVAATQELLQETDYSLEDLIAFDVIGWDVDYTGSSTNTVTFSSWQDQDTDSLDLRNFLESRWRRSVARSAPLQSSSGTSVRAVRYSEDASDVASVQSPDDLFNDLLDQLNQTGSSFALTSESDRLIVEAENFTSSVDKSVGNRGGHYRDTDTDIRRAGDGYAVAWTQVNESLTYQINVQPGIYDVRFLVASSHQNRNFSFDLGGNTYEFRLDGTGWNNFQWVTVSDVVFSEGVEDLTVTVPYAIHFDRFVVEPAESLESFRVEAEDFYYGFDLTKGNSLNAYRTDTNIDIFRDDNSGRTAVGRTQEGEWLTYDLGLHSGVYDLTFAVGSAHNNRYGQVIVGDQVYDLRFNNTGGWRSFNEVTVDGVTIYDNENVTLRLLNGFTIDYIDVELDRYIADREINSFPDLTSDPITVQAEDFVDSYDRSIGNQRGAYRFDTDTDILKLRDGKYAVGTPQAGEWLVYDLNLATGSYDLTFNVASARNNRNAQITVGDETYTLEFDRTGGWRRFTEVTIEDVDIEDGQDLRLEFVRGFVIDSFNVELAVDPTSLRTGFFSFDAVDYRTIDGYRIETKGDDQLLSLIGGLDSEVGVATYQIEHTGTYDIYLNTFDENDGISTFNFYLNGQEIGDIVLNQDLGEDRPSSETQVSPLVAEGIAVQAGDVLSIEGFESQAEHARISSIDFLISGTNINPNSHTVDVLDYVDISGYREVTVRNNDALSFIGGGENESGFVSYEIEQSGRYNVVLSTFDENDGVASFEAFRNDSEIGNLVLHRDLGGDRPFSFTNIQEVISYGEVFEAGDILTIRGQEDGRESAVIQGIDLVAVDF